MPAVEHTVKRPESHPGPGVLRLLLKGNWHRMERGTAITAKLDPEADAKVLRDLASTGYEVTASAPAPARVRREPKPVETTVEG